MYLRRILPLRKVKRAIVKTGIRRIFFPLGGAVLLLGAVLPVRAFAWMAVDTFSCRKVEILQPEAPVGVEAGGEVEFEIQGERFPRVGETTGWLPKCFGNCCLGEKTPNFEVDTFSKNGLLYLRPLEEATSP